ncbi:MAG: hypothetical protein HW419_921 [Deltaproteobacteria bacterium]|nr:hypothetical protein [Deltaproteobacteria bacterium]
MFSDWSYSQTFRAIGQSLEEFSVQDFSLSWEEGTFVMRGQRKVNVAQGWLGTLFQKPPRQAERSIEIRYPYRSILWLQIQGEGMRRQPNLTPDYFRLSQTLRTVGAYVDNMTLKFLELRRVGGNFVLEFEQRDGKKRIEEHGLGSFANYFLHTYLRGRKKTDS